MSRALNAIEDLPNLSGFDREAALMDESHVAYDLPPDDGAGEATISLEDFIGQEVFETTSGSLGILSPVRSGVSKRIIGYKIGGRELQRGTQILLPDRSLYRITGSIDSSRPKFYGAVATGKASEGDLERWFGGGGGGTGDTYHPPAWKPGELDLQQQGLQLERDQLKASIAQGESELAWAKEEFKKAQAAEDRRAAEYAQLQIDLLEKRLDNDNRQLLITEIGAGTRTVFQAQEAERGRQQEMAGEDPFRFTATLRGRGVAGPTPTDIFKQQGASFVNQPLPQFSINDPIPVLEAGLQGLQKMAVSGAPQGLIPGMAQGGTVGQGPFGVVPTWVGERGPELALLAPGSSIVPLDQIAGAQGGVNIPGLDLGGFPDLTSYLRRSTGFPDSPFGLQGEALTSGSLLTRPQASALGAQQAGAGSLFRLADGAGAGTVFVIDEQGRARGFTGAQNFLRSGFRFEDAAPINQQQLARLERGPNVGRFSLPPPNYEAAFGAVGQPLSVRQGMLELAEVNPSFSRQDAINLSNTIGFLPAPHKIAREFSLLDPTEQQGLISLYELAGFPVDSFQRAMGAATPQAGPFGGRRIGFTGGY